MAWNDLASNECPTKADIEGVFARFVPGMIIAFKGSSIPSGWALCDGANGTPNLIGKFIRCLLYTSDAADEPRHV